MLKTRFGWLKAAVRSVGRLHLRSPQREIAGGLLALAVALNEIFAIVVLTISILALALAFAAWSAVKRKPEDDLDLKDVTDRLEDRAKRWMRSDPVFQPDKDTLPDGKVLLDQVNGFGAPPDLSDDAIRLLLLLSIQYGQQGRWWVWFRRARDLPDIADLLTVPLATAARGWLRVAARAAYLMQCLPGEEVERAASAMLGDRVEDRVGQLIHAASRRTVREWIREYGLLAGSEASKYLELEAEFAEASVLGCE